MIFKKTQDSRSYSMAPEFQSFGAGGLEPAFWQTSPSPLHAKSANHRLNYGGDGGADGQEEPRAS